MEVIEISSYTENEKLHIALEHLIPKQLERNGLSPEQLTFSRHAVWKMARNYTKEAASDSWNVRSEMSAEKQRRSSSLQTGKRSR